MDEDLKRAIFKAVENEPFAAKNRIKLLKLDDGYSMVEMELDPERSDNIYSRPHGGAIYALIDEAFETAAQTGGIIEVALNVNVVYVLSPDPGSRLVAEATRTSMTKRTAGYLIKVRDEKERIVATCQALSYRTLKPVSF